ncbi:hypothetical protein [Devosia sp. DBB001]|nr:hypothetical protein [Devosia sp. DBB001]
MGDGRQRGESERHGTGIAGGAGGGKVRWCGREGLLRSMFATGSVVASPGSLLTRCAFIRGAFVTHCAFLTHRTSPAVEPGPTDGATRVEECNRPRVFARGSKGWGW